MRHAIALAEGDIVLVGQSYAGAVIGEAGNDPKVARLVYIDAFTHDAGESAGSLFAQFEQAPLGAEIGPDAEGYLRLTREGVVNFFAQDLDAAEQAVVQATRGRINAAALGGTLTAAAWRSRPTFHLVVDQHRAILRVDQERMAARMDATIAHVGSGHVPMLSHPETAAQFISRAAA